ncbi:MAG: GHKL domain-containing protein [Lachnospiraceae bacterium]|nr:GHKL domain-containing protein [Lachnospiraceae bacterium]
MTIIELLFSAVLNILSVYTNFRIIEIFLDKKDINKYFKFLVYFLTWISNFGIYFLIGNMYITSGSLIIMLLIATSIIYNGSYLRKVVAVFSSVAVVVVVDEIVWRVCLYLGILDKIALFGNLIVSLITILLILFLERFIVPNKNKYISKESYINILLVLLGNIFLIYILSGVSTVDETAVMLLLIMICIIDISTFWLHNKVNEVYSEEIEHQIMKEQILMYKKQFQIIEQSQDIIDSLNHDMKNHLLLIYSYLEENDCDSAKQYIKNTQKYISIPEQYVKTGNQELDAILNYYLDRADKLDCTIETKIVVPNSTVIPEFDMTMLLGNLLDNAIEALEKIKERYLFVGLSIHKGIFIIRVKNYFDGKVIRKNGVVISRKRESGKHGIGIKNVQKIVDKYNGEMKVNFEKNIYTVDIIMYL